MSGHLLTVTAPAAFIRSNDHTHWRNRHKLTAAWRDAAAWAAKAQHLPVFGNGPVHVTATIHRADRRTFDLDGGAPTIKAAIDGLRDAGCLDEDSCHVIPRLTIQYGEPWADAALVLRIEPVEVAA